MLQAEFLRSVQANYERILLEEKPEEKKYQYCILMRGGIKGLLPCSLRYINGSAFLYYDITSKQNVSQLYQEKRIDRDWMKDFLWSLRQIRLELSRFLLDIQNVIWYPEHIFQDLDRSIFSFLYYPYYEGEDSFLRLLDFFVERINYEDEMLVEFVYKMYDRYESVGYDYLKNQIFQDAEWMDKPQEETVVKQEIPTAVIPEPSEINTFNGSPEEKNEKKGLRFFFENKLKKGKADKVDYQRELQLSLIGHEQQNFKIAEEDTYAEEYGQTIYISEGEETVQQRRLYTANDQILVQLDNPAYVIGKKKDEVEVVLEDASISRMHARIIREKDSYYIEDLNSTNGTFKNNLRMQPYEKRELEEGDEIRMGKVVLYFR